MRKEAEVSVPDLATDRIRKTQTVARVHIRRDKDNVATTTGDKDHKTEPRELRRNELVRQTTPQTVGKIQETQNSQPKERIELATFVKIEDTSKEHVENIKDGVQKREELPKL